MRRLLTLAALVLVLFLVSSLGAPPSAQADAMCSTVCPSGATLKCCTTGTCSTVNGTSVNCNGTVLSCNAVAPWYACKAQCEENRDACFENCEEFCKCHIGYNFCINNCGPAPTTNIGCP